MKRLLLFFSLFLSLLALPVTGIAAAETPTNDFERVLQSYELVRQSLIGDSMAGIADNGQKITQILTALESEFSPARAGIDETGEEPARGLLPEMREAAEALAKATDLATARDAFYSLSKPLVRWRKVATGERPVVAYCSMARRSWLQPEGEIGNPYHGTSMLRCGEVVDG